jgi:hypothetical protein
MSLALKKVALTIGFACALASASLAHAQTAGGNTEEKLTEINKRIEVLTTAMAERASGYPEVETSGKPDFCVLTAFFG